MKVAMIGGSFNPLHKGHVALGKSVFKEFAYEKILYVPTFIPPHKTFVDQASAEDRLNMLRATFKNSKIFEVEPCEIERGGLSYTIDTVKYLYKKFEITGKIGLVMGAEIASEFYKWNDANHLAELCDLIIAPRKNVLTLENLSKNIPSGEYSGGQKSDGSYNDIDSNFKWEYKKLKKEIIPVSSTQIRQKIKCGKDFRHLVPKAVFEYIKRNELYGYKN